MRELEYPFDAEEIIKKKKNLKRTLLNTGKSFTKVKIAILGGFTTNTIKNVLELFLLNYGIAPEFYESEYNQFYEDAMFPNETLEKFAPDLIYFCTCNHNILEYPDLQDSQETVNSKLDAIFTRFVEMWEMVSGKYKCSIIQNNFEFPFYRIMGNMEASDYHGRINFITRLNLLIYDYAQKHENFYIYDVNYASASYGLEKWADPYYWHMYKYSVCVPAIPYYAFGLSHIIKAIYGKNKKVLMLDMDNTLWGGVIGDDGVDNIEIGQETSIAQTYTEFQEYIKKHKERGVLLTINSKNDEEVARTGLRRPDSVLNEDDFVMIKCNWEPKDQNLIEAAQELNLLPESFVFVDDNPAERLIVNNGVEGVSVPDIGQPEQYIRRIDRNGYFEMTQLSEDDLQRSEMYQSNAKRSKEKSKYRDYREYLLSLEMKGKICPFESLYMSRICQLTNKSNQFNLTTRRYSQAEIEQVARDKGYVTLYGKLEDRFGDNGIVSVVIGEIKEQTIHIDLWIMSCRVLKRDMEYAMMDELIRECKDNGINEIYGYYYPTAKNGMVKDFYALQGFQKLSEDEHGNATWRYDIPEKYINKNEVISIER